MTYEKAGPMGSATPLSREPMRGFGSVLLVCFMIVLGTVVTMAGIDLMLPAVPSLPDVLGGDPSMAQYVVAAYMGGSSLGLVLLGSIAHRYDNRRLLVGSLAAFAFFSAAGALAPDMFSLIVIRFLQGMASCGAHVLTAPMLRRLFSEAGAVRALSLIGSVQALVPGFAPIAGAWLIGIGGWTLTFWVTAVLSAIVAVFVGMRASILPVEAPSKNGERRGSYLALARNASYLRYALTHALILGGLITFVFSAPYVIAKTMDGTVEDFVLLQMVLVGVFIVSSNIAGLLVTRIGAERLIFAGTLLVAASAVALLAFAFAGGRDPFWLYPIMIPVNIGLGIRGGIGFVRSLAASAPDEARGSAALMLGITLLPTVSTALVAPFIEQGLVALAIAFAVIVLPALLLVLILPPLKETAGTITAAAMPPH